MDNQDTIQRYTFWVAIGLLLLGNLVQSLSFVNHDVGWVLYSSGRFFEGGVFGRDIIAANPPLIWWISAIPNGVASITPFDAVTVYRIAVLGLSLAVLVDLNRMIADQLPPLGKASLLIVFSVLVGFGAGRDFGQREHLALLLCIPYLTRAALLVQTGVVSRRANWLASIGAGIGVAFKPYFLLMPVLVELFVALRLQRVRLMIRPDILISVGTVAVYVLAVWVFARPYLVEVIPNISEVYWGFGWSAIQVARWNMNVVMLVLTAVGISGLLRFSALSKVFSLAALAFLAAALIQKKGYSYHLYPAVVFACLSLACALTASNVTLRAVSAGVLVVSLYFQGQSGWHEIQGLRAAGAVGSRIQAVIEVVQDRVPPGGSFLAISTHPFPGFPVSNYASRDWLALTNSRIGLPAIVRMRENGFDGATSELLARVEKRERRAMLKDLGTNPDLVLVAATPRRHAIGYSKFDFLSFYLEDSEFRRLWQNYEEIDVELDEFKAFKRKRSKDG